MEVKIKDLIELLDLEREYEEFKKVMDTAVERFISCGYDEDFLIYRLKKYFEKEKRIILMIFLERYREEKE
ncbi:MULTISPECIES: hypothetical protein [Dictyoglomus]|uniref:Uncharacterized protein n=1 Tax=Dictyoglomus turgidum (strain DSM 6724 / Z-1310) TaxID=515635 RepID=B8E0C3_DICTD|nr:MULTISPECIES: hypothetical protein [Dictyoglomus]ACK42568.1 hypothetical protein Dtur_1290 [Dictyoglomus turgidum DSM 6724]HBU31208.1 hypothetical protein [Dictyoglomus sp.]